MRRGLCKLAKIRSFIWALSLHELQLYAAQFVTRATCVYLAEWTAKGPRPSIVDRLAILPAELRECVVANTRPSTFTEYCTVQQLIRDIHQQPVEAPLEICALRLLRPVKLNILGRSYVAGFDMQKDLSALDFQYKMTSVILEYDAVGCTDILHSTDFKEARSVPLRWYKHTRIGPNERLIAEYKVRCTTPSNFFA